MKSRLPIVSTVIVALAVAAMVALGFWQLDRKHQKEAALQDLAANLEKPAIAYPELGPLDPDLRFRASAVTCLSVENWIVEAGKAADGSTGFRYIADCRTGAEGPGARVAIGIGPKPDMQPKWTGGYVDGTIVPARDERMFFDRVMGKGVAPGPMLLSNRGIAGLKAPARPSPDNLPNNHLSYAVQWFAFAGAALIIYLLALRYKRRESLGIDTISED